MPVHFSYGSNMDVAGMRLRCPAARPIGAARLPGWQFFIAACGYASLRRRPLAVTFGIMWRLDDSDLAALDLYEDVAGGLYRKVSSTVETVAGRRQALVYLTRDTRTGQAHPGYQDGIVDAARGWRFPRAVLRDLETWIPARRGVRPLMP